MENKDKGITHISTVRMPTTILGNILSGGSIRSDDHVGRSCGRYCDLCNSRINDQEIYTSIDEIDYCQSCKPLS